MRFLRQECWSGLPFPLPGNLSNPGTEPLSPALQVDSLPLSHHGSPKEEHSGLILIRYGKILRHGNDHHVLTDPKRHHATQGYMRQHQVRSMARQRGRCGEEMLLWFLGKGRGEPAYEELGLASLNNFSGP